MRFGGVDVRRFLCSALLVAVGWGVPAPLMAQTTGGDAGHLRQAIEAFEAGDRDRALAARARIAAPLVQTIVTWYAGSIEDSVLPFQDLTAFIETHEDWPLQRRLRRNVDAAIDPQTPTFAIVSWYRRHAPVTAPGRIAAIARLRQAGETEAAIDMIRHMWRRSYIGRSEQRAYLNAYRDWLRPEDHVARINYLMIYGHKRAVEQLLPETEIDEAHRLAVQARLLMRARRTSHEYGRINAMLQQLPPGILAEEGMHYDLMRWHRRAGREEASLILVDAAPARTERPDRWYKERNIHVRLAVKQRQFDRAYRVAAEHRQAATPREARAEWLAGYVALRFQERLRVAQGHFERALAASDDARERARALYWLGRTEEAAGHGPGADERFRDAARYTATFYGQMARARLGAEDYDVAAGEPGAGEQAKFADHYFVRTARLLGQLGRTRHARVAAIYAVRHAARTEAQALGLLDQALQWYPESRRRYIEVALIRYAHYAGLNVTGRGFPTIALPDENRIEPALVYALIRQESGFKVNARSWAGARGLMQLMPFTARREARDLGVPYSLGRLTSDADYNLRLGTAHLVRLMNQYDGTYPLVLAAYNAGAHRVDRWLSEYGDPRQPDSGVEWVDWIELIPFDETRDYVKRVLSGHTIYRRRVDPETGPQRLISGWTVEWPVEHPDCNTLMATDGGDGNTYATTHGAPDSRAPACAARNE